MRHKIFRNSVVFAIFLLQQVAFGAEINEPKLVKIGMLSFRPPTQTISEWQPTADYLSERIKGYRFEIIPLGYPELDAAVAKNELDFISTNPAHYVALESLFGATRISTLVRMENNNPEATLGGVIFTRSNRDDINSLKEIKGKKVAAVQMDSLGGYVAQKYEMQNAGVKESDFAKLTFTGMPHDNVVYVVLRGEADVGMVRTGVLEWMAKEGKIKLDDFKVLALKDDKTYHLMLSTKLYPEWPFAKATNTPNELATQVLVALLDIKSDSVAAKKGGYYSWTVPLDYDVVHELLKTLKLRPYEHVNISFKELIVMIYPWLLGGVALFAMLSLIGYREHRTNRKLEKTQAILAIIDKFREQFITQRDPFLMYQALRDGIVELTQSEYGFIGEALEDSEGKYYLKMYALSNLSWNEETTKLYERYKDIGFDFKKLDNLFGRAITHREIVISNNPSIDPRRAGLPHGHPPINSFLGIPVYYGERLVGEIGLANRPKGYTYELVNYLNPVVLVLGQIIVARQEKEARKKAEAELKESETRLRELLEASPIAVRVAKADGREVVFSNNEYSKLINTSAKNVLGKNPKDYYVNKSVYDDILERLSKGEEIRDVVVELNIAEGRTKWALASYSNILFENELSILGWFYDITKQKNLELNLQVMVELEMAKRAENERLLVQKSKMADMGEMIGVIAHQWKQPLNAINIHSQMLSDLYEDGVLDGVRIKEYERFILDEVNFMSQTMNDFRNFYKPDAEALELNIKKEIEIVHRILSAILKVESVELFVNGDECCFVRGYANEFKQVILNIINNARDVIVENGIKEGRIDCCFEVKEGMGIIRIKDNGGGISEALLPDKIFDPYISTKGEKGTGIGLSISKTIIEKHMGGKLYAHNVKGGAEFVIALPLAKEGKV